MRPQAATFEDPALDETGDSADDTDDSGDEASEDDDAACRIQGPSVKLQFSLPAKYPDEKPSLQIIDSSELEEYELTELLENLSNKMEESLGNVMIFILVSDVVEWLSGRLEEMQALDNVEDVKQRELEEEERRKIDGTPVTVASFLAWKAKFDAEMLRLKLEQQKKPQSEQASSVGARRLTGKEMFERDKALAESDLNFVDELEQDQLEALMQNIDDLDLADQISDMTEGLDEDDDDEDKSS